MIISKKESRKKLKALYKKAESKDDLSKVLHALGKSAYDSGSEIKEENMLDKIIKGVNEVWVKYLPRSKNRQLKCLKKKNLNELTF